MSNSKYDISLKKSGGKINKIIKNIFKVFILVLLILGLYKHNLDKSNIEINAETEESTEGIIEDSTYSEGLSFTLSSDKSYYTVSKGTCTDTEVVIPETYEGLPVKEIASSGFSGYTTMTSIVLPNSIIAVKYDAFYNCNKLEKVVFKGNLDEWFSLDFNTFRSNPMFHAKNLYVKDNYNEYYEVREFEFPSFISDIRFQFVGLNMTSITIPNSVTSIGNYAFEYCTSLTIHCEAISKPVGWFSGWNYSECAVIWGYTGNES